MQLPAPWTSDAILQSNRFCNIYRFNDRGTQYIWHRILNQDYPVNVKLLNVVAYRLFNRLGTFDGEIFTDALWPEEFSSKLPEYLEQLYQVQQIHSLYNTAYLVCSDTPFKDWVHPRYKGKYVQILLTLQWLSQRIDSFLNEFQACQNAKAQLTILRRIPFIGEFTSGQILVDLGYCGVTKFTNNDWVQLGPGSTLGLCYLDLPRCDESVERLQDMQEDFLGPEWNEIASKGFHCGEIIPLMDLQNSLCEFSKYWRYKHGIGKRRRYNAGGTK